MKFSPVRIDEKPLTKIPRPAATTYEFENVVLNGA
jgi:hypothetical protein